MKRTLTYLLSLLMLLIASIAVAAPDEDAARIFSDGQRLFEKGDYEEALVKFKKTIVLMDSPNARLYLARTHHELGQIVEAYEEMVRTKEQAAASDDPKYVHTRDIAAARLAVIERELGRVIVVASGADGPIELTIGNRKIPSEKLGKMIPVAPGTVQVVAQKADGGLVRKEVEVAAGALVTVSLNVGADAPTEPAPPDVQPLPPDPEPAPDQAEEEGDGTGALIPAGVVVASVGVAGMVVFAIAGSMALDKHGSISDECGDIACPEARYNGEIDDGQTLQTVANVGFGVGLGGLAVGAALIVIGVLTGDPEAPSSDGVAVQAGPDGAFLGYSASF